MAVTPDQIVALAATLADGASECEWRSAASRSYYAAFHAAKVTSELAHVDKWLQDTSSFGCGFHEEVIQRFAWAKARTDVRAAGYGLRQLKQERVKADYALDEAFRKKDALAAVASGKDLLQQFAAIDAAAKAAR
jgi:hypothetical protein